MREDGSNHRPRRPVPGASRCRPLNCRRTRASTTCTIPPPPPCRWTKVAENAKRCALITVICCRRRTGSLTYRASSLRSFAFVRTVPQRPGSPEAAHDGLPTLRHQEHGNAAGQARQSTEGDHACVGGELECGRSSSLRQRKLTGGQPNVIKLILRRSVSARHGNPPSHSRLLRSPP